LVAYDLIPFFQQWATRLAQATPHDDDWVAELIAVICPDDEYNAWDESEDAQAERARDHKAFRGRQYRRRTARHRLFGVWEKQVQLGWITAKNRMGKYQSCEACRKYDENAELSPGTLALRLSCKIQPVQLELKRLIRSAGEMMAPGSSDERNGRDDIRRASIRRPNRPNPRHIQIDSALRQCADAKPRSHEEVLRSLDNRYKTLIPHAEPFRSAGGWLAGFQKDPARARAWLSQHWTCLGLRAFSPGPKNNY